MVVPLRGLVKPKVSRILVRGTKKQVSVPLRGLSSRKGRKPNNQKQTINLFQSPCGD